MEKLSVSKTNFQLQVKELKSEEFKEQFLIELLWKGKKQGEIQFAGVCISNINIALINHCWFSDRKIADLLLKETTMFAWEMGFELMVGSVSFSNLQNCIFKKLTFSSHEIFCAELSWNALEKIDLRHMLTFIYCQN